MVLHNLFFLILAIGVYFALYSYLPDHAKTNLFIVLGAIYILAVLVLETTIMPLYVYRPLQLMLQADQATQRGDRDRRASATLGGTILLKAFSNASSLSSHSSSRAVSRNRSDCALSVNCGLFGFFAFAIWPLRHEPFDRSTASRRCL